MCGLAGLAGAGDPAVAREAVARMLGQLAHRGPDGEGFLQRPLGAATVTLGHRRLAIIDPSPAAAQPMASADGALHLILNGEIYNHRELRAELEGRGRRFRTRSDTEVLLEAWAEWGAAALDRVVGMFAFVLLDERRRTLFLARDQFSIKPLFYAVSEGRLGFASEIPPLLELPGVGRGAEPGAVADFLARAVNNHPNRTMFADVRELPGAHLAEVALDRPTDVSPRCYWRPPATLRHDLSLAEAAAGLRALLEESVALHLRSDVPVGFFLSGGQDSSAVVALARRHLGAEVPLHTFSYRGEDGAVDEGTWIDAARRATGAVGHEVRLTPGEWAAEFPALVAAQGEPFGSPVIYAQRRLFQAAAALGIRVVLDGQGSDEYLAGYDRFLPARLASLLRAGRLADFARVAYGYARGGAGWRAPLSGAVRLCWPALSGLGRRTRPPLLNQRWLRAHGASLSQPWRPQGPEVLREMLAAEFRAPNIPWLMRYADRSAMAASVENRLPFLSPRVVEFVLGLPEALLIAPDGTGKQLLREAMRGIVPEEIRARRDRIGFDVPLAAWLAHTPHLSGLLEEAVAMPAVHRDHAGRLLGAVRAGQSLSRPQAFEAWRLVTLAQWVRTFGVTFG